MIQSAYNNIGISFYDLKKYKEAIKCFDTAIELSDNCFTVDAMILKANAHTYLEEYETAIDCYNQLLTLNPNDLNALNNKAASLYHLARFSEALECVNLLAELTELADKDAVDGINEIKGWIEEEM